MPRKDGGASAPRKDGGAGAEDLGRGRDYADRNHTPYRKLDLHCAWKVQNRTLWLKYQAEVEKMHDDLQERGLSAPVLDLRETLRMASQRLPGVMGKSPVHHSLTS